MWRSTKEVTGTDCTSKKISTHISFLHTPLRISPGPSLISRKDGTARAIMRQRTDGPSELREGRAPKLPTRHGETPEGKFWDLKEVEGGAESG